MNPYIVIVTQGKHESVDYISVHLFESFVDARAFRDSQNTCKTKHWKKAELVIEGETVELSQPEGE